MIAFLAVVVKIVVALVTVVIPIVVALVVAIRWGGLARLGGARPGLLKRAAVDTPVFTARGIAAVIPALFGAFAMTAALEYGQQLKLIPAAAGGAAWGVIILLFDLCIMSSDVGGNNAWSWVRGMIFLALRATASILAALVISSMIALFWYRTDIAAQVQRDNQTAATADDRKFIEPRYTPQIMQDKAQAAADQARLNADALTVTKDSNAVSYARLLMQCEKGGVSNLAGCPKGSGNVGSGQVYAVRAAQYQSAQDALTQAVTTKQADRARLLPEISQDQADAAALQGKQNSAEAAELAFQAGHDGLLARQRALSELEAAAPGVGAQVKVMELLIVVIDCSAVIARITSRTPAYDRVVQAEKNGVIWRAEQDERIYRASSQAGGDVEEARIGAWRDAKLRAPGWAGQPGGAGPGGGPAVPGDLPPVHPGTHWPVAGTCRAGPGSRGAPGRGAGQPSRGDLPPVHPGTHWPVAGTCRAGPGSRGAPGRGAGQPSRGDLPPVHPDTRAFVSVRCALVPGRSHHDCRARLRQQRPDRLRPVSTRTPQAAEPKTGGGYAASIMGPVSGYGRGTSGSAYSRMFRSYRLSRQMVAASGPYGGDRCQKVAGEWLSAWNGPWNGGPSNPSSTGVSRAMFSCHWCS